jgi:V8-like Glu-specific endopeptidase
MRELDPHRARRYKQRRRRYAAAALCMGILAAAVVGAFYAEQRPGVQGAAGAAHTTPKAMPAPQPQSDRTAHPSPSTKPEPKSAPRSDLQSAGQSSGSSAAAAASAQSAATDPALAFGEALSAQPTGSPMAQSNPLTGTAFSGLPQVGALFGYDGSSTSSHFCSGSVVASDKGDLVITAAHCVYDSSSGSLITDIAFVPGYHDGQQPYGVWPATRIVVAPQWLDDQDPDYDVAFVVVHQPGSAQRIQDAVGADQLGVDADFAALTQVVGYPSDTEQPISCTDFTKQFSPTQLEFDCPGYPDGTSGGPFLARRDAATGTGTVIGVIGGYEQGGYLQSVSYSPRFGRAIRSLYRTAVAAARAAGWPGAARR